MKKEVSLQNLYSAQRQFLRKNRFSKSVLSWRCTQSAGVRALSCLKPNRGNCETIFCVFSKNRWPKFDRWDSYQMYMNNEYTQWTKYIVDRLKRSINTRHSSNFYVRFFGAHNQSTHGNTCEKLIRNQKKTKRNKSSLLPEFSPIKHTRRSLIWHTIYLSTLSIIQIKTV